MNRVVVFGVAIFFAIVGIAMIGGDRQAVAGRKCGGCRGSSNSCDCGGRSRGCSRKSRKSRKCGRSRKCHNDCGHYVVHHHAACGCVHCAPVVHHCHGYAAPVGGYIQGHVGGGYIEGHIGGGAVIEGGAAPAGGGVIVEGQIGPTPAGAAPVDEAPMGDDAAPPPDDTGADAADAGEEASIRAPIQYRRVSFRR